MCYIILGNFRMGRQINNMLGDFFGDRIFSIFIVPVFKVFGYRMDGRDKLVTKFNRCFLCLFKEFFLSLTKRGI